MAKAPAIQFYTGDFLTGTTLMSNAEVGLYIRLLCLQAEHGSIPDDVERIVRTYGEEARSLWAGVRPKFIPGSTEGTIVNERLSEVLAQRDAFRKLQSEKGKLSASARSLGSSEHQPKVNRGSTVVEPLGVGVTVLTQRRKERASEYPKDFTDFYLAYPNKKAKADALKAWDKLSTADRALCIPAIKAQTEAHHFRGSDGVDYIPHPASWLNARRWEDEVSTTPQATTPAKPMTRQEGINALVSLRASLNIAPGGFIESHLIPREINEALKRTA